MSSKENQVYFSQENILPAKGLKVNNNLLTKNVQPKPNNAHLKNINMNGIKNKINVQKTERGPLKDIGGKNRQSLKPVKKDLVDGKIKKVTQKVNSAGKIKKTKKTNNVVKEDKIAKKEVSKSNNLSKPAKKDISESDFVIFCDENDELTIKAVEKENNIENINQETQNEEKKKKGLAERNLQQNQPKVIPKTTINPTLKAINSNIEILKNAVEPISNLTLEEFFLDEATLNETLVEDRENDPTLMSIDISKDDDLELQQQQTIHIDVAGDMYCQEFSNEIYLYLLERELKFLPDPIYITKQPEINTKMRAMLVDWLIDVGIEFELENETLFLAITYIDLFLSQLSISLQNFQLLGTAALLIASKYEEIYPPDIKEFIFVTDDAYTKLQMLTMEKLILKSLNFNISPPTINYFLKFFLTKLSLPLYVQYFAEYMCFLTILQTEPFLSFSPSDIAISSIIMALHTYTLEDVVNLEEFKKLTKVHFHKDEEGNQSDAKAILIRQTCINEMYKMQKTAHENSQQAVYTKYNSEKYLRVASVEIADEVPLVENFFN